MGNNGSEDMKMDMGRRMAEARKVIGLSQQQVADSLGIPQRTLSYYERGEGDLPCSLLVPLADILGMDVHTLLDVDPPVRRGGTITYLQKRFEAVRELPKKDQQFVMKFLDQVLEDYQRRRRK